MYVRYATGTIKLNFRQQVLSQRTKNVMETDLGFNLITILYTP
jgi:hypothetical protein